MAEKVGTYVESWQQQAAALDYRQAWEWLMDTRRKLDNEYRRISYINIIREWHRATNICGLSRSQRDNVTNVTTDFGVPTPHEVSDEVAMVLHESGHCTLPYPSDDPHKSVFLLRLLISYSYSIPLLFISTEYLKTAYESYFGFPCRKH